MRYDMFDIHNPNHEDLLDLIQHAVDSTKEGKNGQPHVVSLGVLDRRTSQIYQDYLNSIGDFVRDVSRNVAQAAKEKNQDIKITFKQIEYYRDSPGEAGEWVVEPLITAIRKVIKNENNY